MIPISINKITEECLNNLNLTWKHQSWEIILSHLNDSYKILEILKDSHAAFTHLRKAINNAYNKLYFMNLIDIEQKEKFSDSRAIKIFLIQLQSDDNILTFRDYLKIFRENFPKQQASFIANIILKWYVLNESSLPPQAKEFHIAKNFKKNYPELITPIENTFWKKYGEINTCFLKDWEINFTIKKDLEEERASDSQKITRALAKTIMLLIKNWKTKIDNHPEPIELEEKIFFDFLFRGFLYSVRNTSVHWNIISRNKSTVQEKTTKSNIYIFFLGHYFLSILLVLTKYMNIEKFKEINDDNISKLKHLLKSNREKRI